MKNFSRGSVVYVAHPYEGKMDNLTKAAEIIHKLFKDYPEVTFISPLHAILCPYYDVSYEAGMDLCLSLLRKCDGLLLTGDWIHSRGCEIEKKFAYTHDIPVRVLESDYDTKMYSLENRL